MIRQPQVIVTLSPEGTLQIELPGANGARRKVTLSGRQVEETLLRILQAQLISRIEIGEDGAPTSRQVRHWEQHTIWNDDRCPFCLAEGRASGSSKRHALLLAKHGDSVSSVVIRRVPAKQATKQRATRRSEEELGL